MFANEVVETVAVAVAVAVAAADGRKKSRKQKAEEIDGRQQVYISTKTKYQKIPCQELKAKSKRQICRSRQKHQHIRVKEYFS